MFSFWRNRSTQSTKAIRRAVFAGLEPLESRKLLSVSPGGMFGGPPPRGGGPGGPGGPGGGDGQPLHAIAFSLTPAAVQTGLDALATTDGLTDPTATTMVDLNNVNGVETYSVTLNGTGTVSRLTVDQLGDPVTAPTQSTTTWATLNGTGTGSDAAAAAEILAIATAKNLAAPTDTTVVNVLTTSSGAVTYSINLAPAASSTSSSDLPILWRGFGPPITVDAAGNPVGQQQLPFSVFSTTIQNALNKDAPTGATAYNASSTQPVVVRTTDGITTYSVEFTATGTKTQVTVDAAGTLTSLPSTSTITFGALSTTVQTELQTLATADGVTTTIASNQSINVLTETNGTIIYSATLGATGTDDDGGTYTLDVTIAVDSNGNPTTLPHDPHDPVGFFNPGNEGGPGHGAIPGAGDNDGDGGANANSSGGSTANSSSGSTHNGGPGDCGPGTNANSSGGTTSNSSAGSTSNSSAGTISLPGTSVTSSTTLNAVSYKVSVKLLSNANFGLASLGGYFVEFVPPKADAAVQSDLSTLATAQQQLGSDLKGLTAAERKTLNADNKAIAAAIKAMASTLAPLQATLKFDANTWAKTLRADRKAIGKDRKNATALATDQAKLTSDQASAFAAIVTDEDAIQTAIAADAGVTTAQTQLATDLPTIASDQSAVKADQKQLLTDVEAQLSAT